MEFKGKARRLQSLDISRLAHTVGCTEDHLHAVMEVETRGGGFDIHGRIKMLFEPHIFYRELSGAEREEAVAAGLAYRRWGEKRYPKDSYPRLRKAMEINAEAALRSCSWGLGQIMGFNHRLAGYASVAAMVAAFVDDEDSHLAAMIEFIVSNGLDDELRREDWRGFARGYNGSGYAKHGYHLKLKKAFDKWKAIPDTPFTPADIDRSDPPVNPPDDPVLTTRGMALKEGMHGSDVLMLQNTLAFLGYHVGKKDGHFGRLTKRAVIAFQSDRDLVPDGKVGELTWGELNVAAPQEERDHSEDTLRDSGSTTILKADQGEQSAKRTGVVVSSLATIQSGKEVLYEVQEAESMLGGLQEAVLSNWPILILIAIGALIYFKGPEIMQAFKNIRVQAAKDGRDIGR